MGTTLRGLPRIISSAIVLFTLTCAASAMAQPSVTPAAATVGAGAAISFTVAGGPGNRTDWVALYRSSAADHVFIAWQYLNGSMTPPPSAVMGAMLQFTAPLVPGEYDLRLFSNNSYIRLATSTVVTVPAPTVTPAAATVSLGAAIAFTVAGGPGNRFDWVGLYPSTAADGALIAWQYLNGSKTAPLSGITGAMLQFPAPLTVGTYNVRLFRNNEYVRMAASTDITVQGTATVTPAAATVSPGATISFTVAGGPGNRFDWVALYQSSAADGVFIAWQYLNGSMTAPATGVTGATLQFTAPVSPGTYNVRLFRNNEYIRLATSMVVTVPALTTTATVTLAAATVIAGAPISFTVAGGPGNRTDWVALYDSSALNGVFIAWQYLNGLKTPPVSALTGAALHFTAPTTPGTYNVRLFSNNMYVLVGISDPVTVRPLTLSAVSYVSGTSMPIGLVQDPMNPNVQYLVQQAGRIRVIESGLLQATDFLNLSAQIACCGERGLLGLAFPPDYAATRRFYVNFTNLAGHTVVARFQRSMSNPLVADTSTQLNLQWGGSGGPRHIVQPFANHNGGNIVFGPDGYLYIGMGDGGSGNDPQNHAQNPASLLGKMLRIDVGVPDGNSEGYVVPGDNPFVSAPQTLPEIWAFGLRNPWKFSFDDGPGGTNGLTIGDVGQGSWEEVDFEPANQGGRNYGWVHREGAHPTPNVSREPTPGAPATLTDPVVEYPRPTGFSITGGFVYRGAALDAGFNGRYFFADFGTRRVWSVLVVVGSGGELTASGIVEHTAALGGTDAVGNISAFGRDADGELYLVSYGGTILKLVPSP